MIGCHIDDDPDNNNIENLRWDTPRSNVDDRIKFGNYAVGTMHHAAKLTEADIPVIRQRKANGDTLKAIAADYPVRLDVISDIVNRKTWRHVP